MMSEATTSDIIDNFVILRACEQDLITIAVPLTVETLFASSRTCGGCIFRTTKARHQVIIQTTVIQHLSKARGK